MAKRGRKPKEKENYFGEKEEKAVLDYLNTVDEREKNRLYNEILRPAFDKMVECIIRRYNLHMPDEEENDTFNDALSFLLMKASKFKEGKISKKTGKKVRAYSYYQTIVKNHLLGRLKDYKKELNRYPSYDSVPEDISNSLKYIDGNNRNRIIANEIVDKILKKTEEMIECEKCSLKESEIKVGKALINLLNNWDYVLSTNGSHKLNKNAILFFLRESTGLDTKGVRDNLKKFRKEYTKIKEEVIKLN